MNDVDLAVVVGRRYKVLRALYPDREYTLKDLTSETKIDQGNLSRYVADLEDKGLMEAREEKRERGRPLKYSKLTVHANRIITSMIMAVKPTLKETKVLSEAGLKQLVRVLSDEELSPDVKEVAAYTLYDCCSWNTKLMGGREVLREFFLDFIDNMETYVDRKEFSQVPIALEYYISFQLIDQDFKWLEEECYPRLLSLFKEEADVEVRKRVLEILSKIHNKCRDREELADKVDELPKLFEQTFFNPNERAEIADRCWEILWQQVSHMDVGEASNKNSSKDLVLIGHKKCKRVENICRFACHIAEACFDEGVRRKIAERGYAIDDETCLLSLPDNVVKDVHKALRAYRVCLEVNDPDRARNRWERLHFLPQTTEAEEGGIVCLRGLNRDPRNCDGFDCPLEIYGACVNMLAEGTEAQEKTSMDLSDSTKRRKIDA